MGQMNEAKRVCWGLKKELSDLKQKQPLLQQQQQQQHHHSDQLMSPAQVAKAPTPAPSPSAAIAAAVAAATAAASAEHEAVLCHIRSRLSASDALVQASELHAPRERRWAATVTLGQELRAKAHKADVAFAQERSVLVKKIIELQVMPHAPCARCGR